jgi:hypothetical protein
MGLRELSRELSELAVTDQSERVIDLALITYCLNKIFSKVHFQENIADLKKDVISELSRENFGGVLGIIEGFDSEYGAFEGNLVGKARIKIGSRLYSDGLSLSQSASLTGVHVSDIIEYVGETKTHERIKPASVAERFSIAKKILVKER